MKRKRWIGNMLLMEIIVGLSKKIFSSNRLKSEKGKKKRPTKLSSHLKALIRYVNL